MSLQAPLFHLQSVTPPLTGKEMCAITKPQQDAFRNRCSTVSIAIFAGLAAANFVICYGFKVLENVWPEKRYWLFAPISLVANAIFNRMVDAQGHQDFSNILYANEPVNGWAYKKLLSYFPEAQKEQAEVLSKMNFLQLRAAWHIDRANTMALLRGIHTQAAKDWCLIDEIYSEEDVEKIKVFFNTPQVQNNPLLAFELDDIIVPKFMHRAEVFLSLNAILAQKYPEVRHGIYKINNHDHFLRIKFINHFIEGDLLKAFNSTNFPDGYLAMINGDDGCFKMSSWLEAAKFACHHSQKNMLEKLDALLLFNLEAIRDEQKETLSLLLRKEIDPRFLPKSMAKLNEFEAPADAREEDLFLLRFHQARKFPSIPAATPLAAFALEKIKSLPESDRMWATWAKRVAMLYKHIMRQPEQLETIATQLSPEKQNRAKALFSSIPNSAG